MALLGPDDIRHLFPTGTSDEALTRAADDAVAIASLVAPCLLSDALPPLQQQQARAILRKAIAYDLQASDTMMPSNQTIGPASVSYHRATPSSVLFTPVQEDALRQICQLGGTAPGMYSAALDAPVIPQTTRPRYGRW